MIICIRSFCILCFSSLLVYSVSGGSCGEFVKRLEIFGLQFYNQSDYSPYNGCEYSSWEEIYSAYLPSAWCEAKKNVGEYIDLSGVDLPRFSVNKQAISTDCEDLHKVIVNHDDCNCVEDPASSGRRDLQSPHDLCCRCEHYGACDMSWCGHFDCSRRGRKLAELNTDALTGALINTDDSNFNLCDLSDEIITSLTVELGKVIDNDRITADDAVNDAMKFLFNHEIKMVLECL